jgi:hypothetical protein
MDVPALEEPMTRFARALCALYSALTVFLAYCAVLQFQYGPPWAVPLFVAASIVPVIATLRELEFADGRRRAAVHAERAARTEQHRDAVADEIELGWAALNSACCLTGWHTSGGDHDPASCTRTDNAA